MSFFRRFIQKRRKVDASIHLTDKPKKGHIICKILFLDGTELCVQQRKKNSGNDLLELAFYHLDLLEKDYFGLQFVDVDHVKVDEPITEKWLDPIKTLTRQYKGKTSVINFNFRVKFYPSEPSKMREECTRYHVYLQLKNDLLTGKLECKNDVAVDLSALILQSELGDFNRSSHSLELVSEFRFVPNQTNQFERLVFDVYRTYRGLTPEHAEMAFLNKCKYLDMYGVDLHPVIGCDDNNYFLGLTPSGILIFEGTEKIGLFFWPNIRRLDFRSNKLILVLVDSQSGIKTELKFVFRTSQASRCKQIWRCAVEHHSFFRLRNISDSKRTFSLGSRFRFSGRTEYQATIESNPRRSVHFTRRPSRRYPRRQNLEGIDMSNSILSGSLEPSPPKNYARATGNTSFDAKAKAAIRALDDILIQAD